MNLIPEDLQRLYGDRFYMVPGDLPGSDENPDDKVEQEGGKVSAAAPTATGDQGGTTNESSAPQRPSPTGKLIWRPKPTSQVLFILHQAELKEKELTDLLKKIVESIKIPFDAAGFGVLTGEVNESDFQEMPNPYGVVFDHSLKFGNDNPILVEGAPEIDRGTLYFTHKLSELKDDRELKKVLWGHLQEIQKKLV